MKSFTTTAMVKLWAMAHWERVGARQWHDYWTRFNADEWSVWQCAHALLHPNCTVMSRTSKNTLRNMSQCYTYGGRAQCSVLHKLIYPFVFAVGWENRYDRLNTKWKFPWKQTCYLSLFTSLTLTLVLRLPYYPYMLRGHKATYPIIWLHIVHFIIF